MSICLKKAYFLKNSVLFFLSLLALSPYYLDRLNHENDERDIQKYNLKKVSVLLRFRMVFFLFYMLVPLISRSVKVVLDPK